MSQSFACTRALLWIFVACINCCLCASCPLTLPVCRNREVKAALEKKARESINQFLATSLLYIAPQPPLAADTPVRLSEAVEISRNDTTRECSAKIAISEDDKVPALPIEYEVTAGDNGQTFYRWDQNAFNNSITAATMLLNAPKAVGTQTSLIPKPVRPDRRLHR